MATHRFSYCFADVKSNTYPELRAHHNQRCDLIRAFGMDADVPMYVVLFPDGLVAHAFADELKPIVDN